MLKKYASRIIKTVLCVAGFLAAGCHGQGNISYYGIAWISMTSNAPSQYLSYTVTVDSITLTRSDGVVITAVSTPEVVDFAQLKNYSELWSSGAIPDGTYTGATITLDYTDAVIVVADAAGKPVAATVADYQTLTTPTVYSVSVNFDPANLPTITPTYASTSAVLLSVDFDLAASGRFTTSSDVATAYVRPVVSIGMKAPDTHLIRIRGPLINSSVNVQTYTVYIRPFYDEANNIGTVTMFSLPNTVYTLNGKTYVGTAGLGALSVLSAGTTLAGGWTTFETDYNPANGATAGKFNLAYVVAGSTLEDIYTNGISGTVIARNGNTLTLQGATLILNTADTFEYLVANAVVLLGPDTTVTADDNTTLAGLTPDAIAVGQHITARGIYNILSDNTNVIDSTGTSSENTGSVRLQNTEVWGDLVSSAADSLVMNVSTIDGWPVSDFTFTGNGAAALNPAAFLVNTGSIGLPAGTVPGDPVWLSGYMTPFGSAPPDFNAVAVNNQSSVQVAGAQVGGGAPTTPGTQLCGIGSQVCDPAVLQVIWGAAAQVAAPFVSEDTSGFSIDLNKVFSAVLSIGPQVIDLAKAGASPLIVPTTAAQTSTFAPRFMFGNPYTATTTSSVTSTTVFSTFGSFGDFVLELVPALSTTTPALEMSARGVYDPTTNTFTATSIDFAI